MWMKTLRHLRPEPLKVYFDVTDGLDCPECKREGTVYIQHADIWCLQCEWNRKRRYPVPPPPSPYEAISLGPFEVSKGALQPAPSFEDYVNAVFKHRWSSDRRE